MPCYKPVNNFDNENDVLTCDVVGTTDDETSDGELLKTASTIVKDIISKVNITSINQDSFDKADVMAPYVLGFSLPREFTGVTSRIVRDLINDVNVSVFGSLVQNEDFLLEYSILQPNRPSSAIKLKEDDIIKFSWKSNADRIVKTAIIQYNRKEFDFSTRNESVQTSQKTSDVGSFLVKKNNTRTIVTVLTKSHSNRMCPHHYLLIQNHLL